MYRLPVPGERIAETFDEAFAEKDMGARARADPLVVLDPPRMSLASSILSGLKKMRPAAVKMTLPFLVCL
jgi:hypothetical protein